MAVVIEKLVSYGDKPTETLNAVQARKNHTPTDVVIDVMKENNIPMPAPKVDTMGKEFPVAGGNIYLRIYTPKEKKDADKKSLSDDIRKALFILILLL